VPLEDQKQHVRNIGRQVRSEQLESASPEEQHALYKRYRDTVAEPDGSIHMTVIGELKKLPSVYASEP